MCDSADSGNLFYVKFKTEKENLKKVYTGLKSYMFV